MSDNDRPRGPASEARRRLADRRGRPDYQAGDVVEPAVVSVAGLTPAQVAEVRDLIDQLRAINQRHPETAEDVAFQTPPPAPAPIPLGGMRLCRRCGSVVRREMGVWIHAEWADDALCGPHLTDEDTISQGDDS